MILSMTLILEAGSLSTPTSGSRAKGTFFEKAKILTVDSIQSNEVASIQIARRKVQLCPLKPKN